MYMRLSEAGGVGYGLVGWSYEGPSHVRFDKEHRLHIGLASSHFTRRFLPRRQSISLNQSLSRVRASLSYLQVKHPERLLGAHRLSLTSGLTRGLGFFLVETLIGATTRA